MVTGPPKCGKSHVASTIATLHNRALIKFDEVVEWVIKSDSEAGKKITAYLEERHKEKETAAAEREKAFKKAGKKAKELTEEMWVEALKERIRHPECGAGCVFDNLSSKHLPNNPLIAINLIMKSVGNEALTILDMDGIVAEQPANEDGKSERKKSEGSEMNNSIRIVPNGSIV